VCLWSQATFITGFDRIYTVSVGDDKKVKAEFHGNSGKTSCQYDLKLTDSLHAHTQRGRHTMHIHRDTKGVWAERRYCGTRRMVLQVTDGTVLGVAPSARRLRNL
jgi:hypothetical protein